ncbi:MAG: glycoside hydrolase family 3 C-terminal domain-containing protein [Lachnospiraceae bacterium]|nr:glycoside hydrolase family 3 C-terminal domain-containing protein [Lachnospiraceae bacterium]
MIREEAKKRAIELVEKMTVEEMASQLRFDAPAIDRLGIPEYNWWNEGLHGVARAGVATMFPQAIGLGATFDEELLKEVGDVISTEARAKYNFQSEEGDRDIYKGITLWSPNVNLFRDPRWGRGHETYGEDPYLISRLGINFIEGLQGDGEYLKTAACAKHFAVHSGPEALRHHFDAAANMKDMWESYLPQFEACVKEAKVESVMGAYNRTNGEVCCAHSYLMEEVLRGKWGFEGHFVSDCWAVRDFHENHKVTASPEESVKLALEKGCDVNCGCTYQKIMDAYDEGLINEELIKRAAVRLFTTRFLLGMFDKTEYDSIPFDVIECKDHLDVASRAAKESLVLLKNDGILPLDKNKVKKIGVIGPNANSRASLIGNYHGTSSRYVTVLEGIQDYVKDDARVFFSEGCHLFAPKTEFLARDYDRLSEAKAVAANSDVVVLCLGLDESLEGEEGDTGNAYSSGDKNDLKFPPSQIKLLETLIETKVPLIVISMAGSAMDLSLADANANAIIQAWYPGARGGKEVAELLFGDYSPSGKLPLTFYRDEDLKDMPDFEDYSMKGRTYRYIEKEPLYPFGYGLTYADAKVTDASFTINKTFEEASKEGVTICVKAKNAGAVDTEEVLQVYVHVNGTKDEVLNTKLAAFKRVKLAAGAENTFEITVPAFAFTTVDDEGIRSVTGNGADIYVGFNGPDKRSEALTGNAALVLKL